MKDIINYSEISTNNYLYSIIISYILGYLLSLIYIKQSRTLSNHKELARIFPILSITTTIVIAIVKSSLALSLGLVGALSIVRFRTPIKEPEELTYIFLCIAIGLASGADQYIAAIIGFIVSALGIYLNNYLRKRSKGHNGLRLVIKGIEVDEISKIISLLSQSCRRIDFNSALIEKNVLDSNTITFSILPNTPKDSELIIRKLNNKFPKVSISIIDIQNF